MSVPSDRPALSTASAMRSSAARLESRLGAKPALVAEPGAQPAALEDRLQRVVDPDALLQRLGEGGRADRRDHELLDVDVAVGMGAAVEDVHHRHRQQMGVRPTDVTEERQLGRLRGRLGDRERDSEDRVGAQRRLVRRAVQVDHHLVDDALLVGLDAEQRLTDDLVDRLDGLADALAAVPGSAVAELHRLELTGRGAGRHRCA